MKKALVIDKEADMYEILDATFANTEIESMEQFDAACKVYFGKLKAKEKVNMLIYIDPNDDEDEESIVLVKDGEIFTSLLLWWLIEDPDLREKFPNIKLDFSEFEEEEAEELEEDWIDEE